MKLKRITFTGVDARTDIQDLVDIQREYPIAEFGVLTSYHWYENGNRYLAPMLVKSLPGRDLSLALHVCGSAAHDAAVGDWEKIDRHLLGTLDMFRRIQLNVSNRLDNPAVLSAPPYLQQLIVQQRSRHNLELYSRTFDALHGSPNCYVSVLLDASGGQGIDTPLEVLPTPRMVGYAGGFNPDNVADKLVFLLQNVPRGGRFWIDMESGVRTDDWFDTAKVRRVLATCREVVRGLGIEE